MGKPEAIVENYLIDRVQAAGGFTRKLQYIGNSGAPDRLVVMPGGVVIFVECKARRGKLSAVQTHEINLLEAYGVKVAVVDSVNAVDKLLEPYDDN